MLENLKEINSGRKIQAQAESTLEKLLDVETEVNKQYAGKVGEGVWKRVHDCIYLPLYRSLSATLPDYTEQDLQSLLLAKVNYNYNDIAAAQVLGIYTGVLLHVLTERIEKEGKKAVFSFDLCGNRLDFLFHFAKRAGEVTVRNVKGIHLCSYIASYGGKAEKLMIEHTEVDHVAFWAGSYKGQVGTLLIQDNKGYFAASDVGSHRGKVETLLIKNNKGLEAASGAGSNNGKVGTIALYKAGKNAGYEANADRIIEGREALALYRKLKKELAGLKT